MASGDVSPFVHVKQKLRVLHFWKSVAWTKLVAHVQAVRKCSCYVTKYREVFNNNNNNNQDNVYATVIIAKPCHCERAWSWWMQNTTE